MTEAYDFAKKKGISFYLTFIWLLNEAMNDIENFRYSIRGGEVVLLDRREPMFADMAKDSEIFHLVAMDEPYPLEEFCIEAKRKSESQQHFIEEDPEDWHSSFSCLPWLDLTSISEPQAKNIKNSASPSLTWGKFVEENGRKIIDLSIEVNHQFVDGFALVQFASRLSERIKGLK